MKFHHSDMIVWWRAGIVAGGALLVGFALFSFLLYQRVNMIASRSTSLPMEERPALFSPALLDDMKSFWEKKTPR